MDRFAIQSAVDELVKDFAETFASKLKEIEANPSIAFQQIERLHNLIKNHEGKLNEIVDGPARLAIGMTISRSYRDLRRNSEDLGDSNTQLLLWKLEKKWQVKGLLTSQKFRYVVSGIMWWIWGVLTGYGTVPLRIVSVGIISWIVSTTGLIIVQCFEKCPCDNSKEIDILETSYTAFSALVGVGNVNSGGNHSAYFYLILMLTSLLGVVLLASLLSVIAVKIFFGEK